MTERLPKRERARPLSKLPRACKKVHPKPLRVFGNTSSRSSQLPRNIDAIFEYAQEAVQAQSVSELVELSTILSRRQLEMMGEQAREIASAAQKLARLIHQGCA